MATSRLPKTAECLAKGAGMVIAALPHETFLEVSQIAITTQGGVIMLNKLNLMAGIAGLFALIPGASVRRDD
jgi:hypothetical protein